MAEPQRIEGDEEARKQGLDVTNDSGPGKEIKPDEEVKIAGPKSQTIYTGKTEAEPAQEGTVSAPVTGAQQGQPTPPPTAAVQNQSSSQGKGAVAPQGPQAKEAQPKQPTQEESESPSQASEEEVQPEKKQEAKDKKKEREAEKKETKDEKEKEKKTKEEKAESAKDKAEKQKKEQGKGESKTGEKNAAKPGETAPKTPSPPAGIKPGAPLQVGSQVAGGAGQAAGATVGQVASGTGQAAGQAAGAAASQAAAGVGQAAGAAGQAAGAAAIAPAVAVEAGKRGYQGAKKAYKGLKKAGEKLEKLAEDRNKRRPPQPGEGKADAEEGGEDITQGPKRKGGKYATDALKKANLEREAAELAARGIGKTAGKLGVNKKGQEYISITLIVLINLVALIVELALVETVLGGIIFVINLVAFVWWLLSKGRWKKAWPAGCALFCAGPGFYCCAPIFLILAFVIGSTILLCSITQNRIPFGIPVSWVGRAVGVFSSDLGSFMELCSQVRLDGTGTGGGSTGSSGGGGGGGTTTSGQIRNTGERVILTQSDGTTIEILIPETQFTRPAPLSGTGSLRGNQAGYVSPAECRLGDIPYSNEVTMRKVRLSDGSETIASLPVHQTVECIENNPDRTEVRAIQIGKIIRNVLGDPVLGNYVTIEYPNGLRVSYYHLGDIDPAIILGLQVEAGQKIADLGETGQNTFRGTKMFFEIKDNNGNWQPYNPIQTDPNLSILTTFPCVEAQDKQCLLL